METQYSFAAREDDFWSILMINGKDEDFKIVSDPSKLSDNVATTANKSVTIPGFSDVEFNQ
ncbi:hypothetical protein Hanom_Chr15g01391861 [Helianthus anomalus]